MIVPIYSKPDMQMLTTLDLDPYIYGSILSSARKWGLPARIEFRMEDDPDFPNLYSSGPTLLFEETVPIEFYRVPFNVFGFDHPVTEFWVGVTGVDVRKLAKVRPALPVVLPAAIRHSSRRRFAGQLVDAILHEAQKY